MKKPTVCRLVAVISAMAFAACASAPLPVAWMDDDWKPSVEHFQSIRRGPWTQEGNTDFRIYVDHENQNIYITGQESRCRDDWRDNFSFWTGRGPTASWFGEVRVHAGFLRQYQSARNTLLNVSWRYPDYAIRVTGYSLGAAWLQIFMQDVLHVWPERDITAIFYSPGNPWRRLPQRYRRSLRERTVFIYNRWDFITWMGLLGFFRYGENIRLGSVWRMRPNQHHPYQVIRGLEEKARSQGVPSACLDAGDESFFQPAFPDFEDFDGDPVFF
ncbi:MAG: hypothetical protein FWC65_01080 [Treponema sp.]|nr:hypothetical protein [Treponema sp.]